MDSESTSLNENADPRDELGRLLNRCEISDQRIEAWCGAARGQKAQTIHETFGSDETAADRARRIPATKCETLARFSPQTAKPESLRRSTPETGVR
jgi:hypothetical protein